MRSRIKNDHNESGFHSSSQYHDSSSDSSFEDEQGRTQSKKGIRWIRNYKRRGKYIYIRLK
jgi:hypothetical protein